MQPDGDSIEGHTPHRLSRRADFGALLVLAACLAGHQFALTLRAADYAVGADLCFLRQAEQQGAVFKDGGQEKPALQIFRDHGHNWIRLRLVHTPTRLPNSIDYTIASAQDARKLGFKFLLNYHYSDTWADPGKQTIPQTWQGKSHSELVETVFEYTRDTVAAFRDAGVLPDMVQVGNEISPGMLWPDGKLPQNWTNFAELVKAGIRGVSAGCGTNARPRIMIHIDKGGNPGGPRRNPVRQRCPRQAARGSRVRRRTLLPARRSNREAVLLASPAQPCSSGTQRSATSWSRTPRSGRSSRPGVRRSRVGV